MAGIFHAYYTVALAPAIAALVGMGAVECWEHRDQLVGSLTLAVATAADRGLVASCSCPEASSWNSWLRVVVLAVGLAAALGFLVVGRVHQRAVPVIVAAALFAGLLGPAAYSIQTVSTGHSGSIVDAGPSVSGSGFGRGGGGGGFPGGAPGGTQGGTQGRTNPFGGTAGVASRAVPARRAASGTQGTPGGQTGAGTTRGAAVAWAACSTPAPRATAVVAALSQNADQYTWVAAAIGSQNAAGLPAGHPAAGDGDRRLQRQ